MRKDLLTLLIVLISFSGLLAQDIGSVKVDPDYWPDISSDNSLIFDFSNDNVNINQDWLTSKMSAFNGYYSDKYSSDQLAAVKRFVVNLTSTSVSDIGPLNAETVFTNLQEIYIEASSNNKIKNQSELTILSQSTLQNISIVLEQDFSLWDCLFLNSLQQNSAVTTLRIDFNQSGLYNPTQTLDLSKLTLLENFYFNFETGYFDNSTQTKSIIQSLIGANNLQIAYFAFNQFNGSDQTIIPQVVNGKMNIQETYIYIAESPALEGPFTLLCEMPKNYLSTDEITYSCLPCTTQCLRCTSGKDTDCVYCYNDPRIHQQDYSCQFVLPDISDNTVSIDFNTLDITNNNVAAIMTQFSNNYQSGSFNKLVFNLNINKITALDSALNVLSQYAIQTIEFTAQGNQITNIDSLSMYNANIQSVSIDLSSNQINSFGFVTNIFAATSIQNLQIILKQNSLTKIDDFKGITSLTQLQSLVFDIQSSTASYIDLSPLSSISQLSNLVSFTFRISQSLSTDDQKVISNFNSIMNLKQFTFNDKNTCILNGYFIDPTVDAFCSKCNVFCTRCFGSLYNQCFSCVDSMKFNQQTNACEFDFGGLTDIARDLSNLDISDDQFNQLIEAIVSDYQAVTISLKLDNNQFMNYAELSQLSTLPSLKTLVLILSSSSSNSIDYSFASDYNKMLSLISLTIDSYSCDMSNNYVSGSSSLTCTQCQFQCQKCFGSDVDQCVTCITSTTLSDNTCNFDYSNPENLAFNKLNIQESQLSGIVSTIVSKFSSTNNIQFDIRQNNLNDFTSLGDLGDQTKMISLKNIGLQIKDSSVQTKPSYQFLKTTYNANLNLFMTVDQMSCNKTYQYLSFNSDFTQVTCSDCAHQCLQCTTDTTCLTCLSNPNVDKTQNCKIVIKTQLSVIDLSNLRIINSDITGIINQIIYSGLTQLNLNLTDNLITDYSGLIQLQQMDLLQSMSLYTDTNIDLTISTNYNKMSTLQSFSLNMFDCQMSTNFIQVQDQQLVCQACDNQCLKCFGLDQNNCLSCIDTAKLNFNTYQCWFNFGDTQVDLSNIKISQTVFDGDFTDQFNAYYTDVKKSTIQSIQFQLQQNKINDLSAIPKMFNFTSLKTLSLNLVQNIEQQSYDYISQFNTYPNLNTLQINNDFTCSLDGYFVQYQEQTLSCSKCYKYCTKCQSALSSTCTKCISDPRITQIGASCQFLLPEMTQQGELNFNFSNLQLDNNDLQTLMNSFTSKYSASQLLNLTLNFQGNQITDFSILQSIPTTYTNLANVTLLLEQQAGQKYNMPFLTSFNQLQNLTDLYIDQIWCNMSQNYAELIDSQNWQCSACLNQCQKCFGDGTQCLSCLDINKLAYDSTQHTCSFSYPPIISYILDIDFSAIRVTDDQFNTIISYILGNYDLTLIEDLTLNFQNNLISTFSPLSQLTQIASLTSLKLYLKNGGAMDNYQFMSNYNIFQNLNFFQLNDDQCNLGNNFILVSDDFSSWTCPTCYMYCQKCSGDKYDQCYSCSDSRLFLNITECDYHLSDVQDSVLANDFKNIKMDDSLFTTFMSVFDRTYSQYKTTTQIKSLVLDISNNNILDVSQLSELNQYLSIEKMELDILQQQAIVSYEFMSQFNSMPNLTLISTSDQSKDQCNLNGNYISGLTNEWQCLSCIGFCKQCFGPEATNCKSCIGRADQLQYDSTLHSCSFVYYSIQQGNVLLDYSNLAMTDNDFQVMLDGFDHYYQDTLNNILNLEIDLDQNQIQDISGLQKFAQELTSMQSFFVSLLGLQVSTVAFFEQFNALQQLSYISIVQTGSTLKCRLDDSQYLAVEDNAFKCQNCYQLCSKCQGSSQFSCMRCISDTKLSFNTQTNSCEFVISPVQDQSLTLEFSNLRIDDYLFVYLLNNITQEVPPAGVYYLNLYLDNNQIINMDYIQTLMNFTSLKNLTIDLDNNPIQNNYTVFAKFNDMESLNYFHLDINVKLECNLSHSYIQALNDVISCNTCFGLCGRCFGSESNQCKSCIKPDKFNFNASINGCEFIIPDIQDNVLDIDFSDSDLDQDLFIQLVQNISQKFADVSSVTILRFNLSGNSINSFEPLSMFATYQNLQEIYFDLSRQSSQVSTTYSFMTYFNDLPNMKVISDGIRDQCQLSQRHFISVSPYSWSCGSCIGQCQTCYSDSSDQQCKSCIDSRFNYDSQQHICTYVYPILQSGKLIMLLNSSYLTDDQFAQIVDNFQTQYSIANLQKLYFDIRDNQNLINNIGLLSFLSNYVNLISLTLNIFKSQDIDLSFIQGYNSLPQLQSFMLDNAVVCDLSTSYIISSSQIYSSLNSQLTCGACYELCYRCSGPDQNECKDCVDDTKFQYDSSLHTCSPKIPSDPTNIDFSGANLQDEDFTNIVDKIITTYDLKKTYIMSLDFSDNNITDFTPMDQLTKFSELRTISLFMKDQKQGNVTTTFLEVFNNMTQLSSIYVELSLYSNSQTQMNCQMSNHFISIPEDKYNCSCAQCHESCKRCFAPSIKSCTVCNDGYANDTKTMECVKTEPKHKKVPGWGVALIVLGSILVFVVIISGLYFIQKKKMTLKFSAIDTENEGDRKEQMNIQQQSEYTEDM